MWWKGPHVVPAPLYCMFKCTKNIFLKTMECLFLISGSVLNILQAFGGRLTTWGVFIVIKRLHLLKDLLCYYVWINSLFSFTFCLIACHMKVLSVRVFLHFQSQVGSTWQQYNFWCSLHGGLFSIVRFFMTNCIQFLLFFFFIFSLLCWFSLLSSV